MELGPIGAWAAQLRSRDTAKIADVAAAVEKAGFGTAWVPGGAGGDLFGAVDAALDATTTLTVATGILNIWAHEVGDTARWHAATRGRHPGRMLLGLGASHAPLVQSLGQEYRRPLAALRDYLDRLDAADPPVPADQRILAALGPRMLELAAGRSIGAHPYLTGPAHTRTARATMGPDAVLAPELKVVLETDPVRARAIARDHLGTYLGLPNYTRNLLREGYDESDLADGGSDHLVDGVVAWGDVDHVVGRARAQWDAGADHVCVQVLTEHRGDVPFDAWSVLGPALLEAAPRP